MVRSDIAGYGRGSNIRCAACAIVLMLGTGLAGAQSLGVPGFSSAVDTRIPVLAGSADDEECDPSLADEQPRNHYGLLLASLDPGSRAARARNPGARAVPNEALPVAAASTAPAAGPAAAPVQPKWEIVVADKTLNVTMARWAAQAGWQLLWELPVDYAVEAHTQVNGSFEDAVATVARSMESAEIPMKAVFYQGNKVLRIMAKGSE